ncbi:Uncharacterised protein g6425 [Pycnogonum litorale]
MAAVKFWPIIILLLVCVLQRTKADDQQCKKYVTDVRAKCWTDEFKRLTEKMKMAVKEGDKEEMKKVDCELGKEIYNCLMDVIDGEYKNLEGCTEKDQALKDLREAKGKGCMLRDDDSDAIKIAADALWVMLPASIFKIFN